MKQEYLKSNRLEDILFLIQLLGLSKYTNLQKRTQSIDAPRSAPNWHELGRKHPEFFRVSKDDSTSLALRYLHNEGQGGSPPPLSAKMVQELMNTAIAIHERQARGAEVWKIWFTMISAAIAAIASAANWLVPLIR